jgi:hypothetical protein
MIHPRINLTTRAPAPLFGISQLAVDRNQSSSRRLTELSLRRQVVVGGVCLHADHGSRVERHHHHHQR